MALPSFLDRWFGTDVPLSRRIGASAFLIGLIAMSVTGGISMLLTLAAIPRAELEANRQSVRLLTVQLEGQIAEHERNVRNISESSLVWTAISDSFGREAYLRPYLKEQSKGLPAHSLQLRDYRARRVSGNDLPAAVSEETISQLVGKVLGEKRPMGLMLPGKEIYIATAYPVLYPYTSEPIGVLLSVADLDHVVAPLLKTLEAGRGLRLWNNERLLISQPGADITPRQAARQTLELPEPLVEFPLSLEYFSLHNTWLPALLMQAAVYLLAALLLGWLIWWLARRGADRLTARLTALANACDAIVPGQPPVLPDDTAGDEIGRLTLTLRLALEANALLNSQQEARIALKTYELSSSEANFHSFFDSIDYFAFVLDMDGKILHVNQLVLERLGYSAEALLGQHVLMVHPEARRAEAGRIVGEMLEGKVDACPVPLQTRAGELIPVETRVVQGQWDGRPALFGISKDITERLRAEEALRESEYALRRAQQVANIGSWQLDARSNTLRWSETTYRIFALAPGTTLTYDLFLAHVLPEDRALVDAAWHNAMSGAPYDISHRILAGNRTKWVRERAELEFNADGSLKAGIGTVQDITAQVETEEALREASAAADAANQAKSAFLATMSHEIRTPLNAVIGLSHLALDASPSSELRDYLEKISNAGNGLLGIINDILDFSKIEAGHMQVEHVAYAPREVIDDARNQMESVAQAKNLTLGMDISADLPQRLIGDPTRLRQILLNLLGNAIKFTPAGEVVLQAYAEGNRFICNVVDTGIGIPPEQLPLLFNPFTQADSTTTRNYGGSGLGLAICRRLAQLMEGTLGCDSTPGEGSTFTLLLPLEIAAEDAVPPAPTFFQTGAAAEEDSLTLRLEDARVLLVEDNVVNQQIGRMLLKKIGIDAALAANGAEAVELVEQNNYDLILMDIHMPVMDGLEATRRIRERHAASDLPIVAMTADAFEEDRERCLAAGMNDHIAKPLDIRTFPATIRRWLSR